MVTRSEELRVNGEGRRDPRGSQAQDILEPEMPTTVTSPLLPTSQIFVTLGAVNAASIPSRAPLSGPIKETCLLSPYKAGKSRGEQR
jgi:hypothetical protein